MDNEQPKVAPSPIWRWFRRGFLLVGCLLLAGGIYQGWKHWQRFAVIEEFKADQRRYGYQVEFATTTKPPHGYAGLVEIEMSSWHARYFPKLEYFLPGDRLNRVAICTNYKKTVYLPEAFVEVQRFPEVQEITLRGRTIRDVELESIRTLPNLEYFDVSYSNFKFKQVLELKSATTIESLCVDGIVLDPVDFRELIETFRELDVLHIENVGMDRNWRSSPALAMTLTLKFLGIGGNPEATQLLCNRNLSMDVEMLQVFNGDLTDDVFERIKKFHKLEYLRLLRVRSTESTAQRMGELKRLKSLWFYSIPLRASTINQLLSQPQLIELHARVYDEERSQFRPLRTGQESYVRLIPADPEEEPLYRLPEKSETVPKD